MVKAALQFLANLLGFAGKRQELVNSPEMQAAKKGGTDQELKDSAADAIAKKDADEMRRRLAE